MKLIQRSAHCLVALLLATGAGALAQEKTEPKPVVAKTRDVIEKEFAEKLSGSTLTGHFTLDDDKSGKPLKEDRYQIATVAKAKDDNWLFIYLHKDVPIPLSLKVLWAGNTPVLTLDEFTVPGLGAFSARVMFHGDRYAGTWQHGDKGGLMFGRVERTKKADAPAADSKPKADAAKPAEAKPEK